MRFLLLILCMVWVEVTGKLDFSQFYLPPCCLTSPPEIFSNYASRIGALTSKREVSTGAQNVTMRRNQDKLFAPSNTNNENMKFYSLIIPINDRISKRVLNPGKFQNRNYQRARKPLSIEKLLVPETPSDDNSQQFLSASKIFQKIFNSEEKPDDIKRITRRMYSALSESAETDNSPREHRSEPQIQSRIVNNYINWESKKISGISKTESNQLDIHQISQKSSATEQNQQIMKRIPSSWVKYLKRALYQSITDGQGITDGENTFYNRNDARAKLQKSKIRFPDTWKSIKSAQLQYVDKMAQVSTSPNSAIYLPPDEGPIVSGILINSPDGNLHLRVASELYFPSVAQDQIQNCGCYLLNPGEILVAYWAVSRVIKESGLPALQYLVYPLPHSVPTPPQILPFAVNEMFHPSSIDPLTNFYDHFHQNSHSLGYQGELPHREPHHGHMMTRNPKPIEQFQNDEHIIENVNPTEPYHGQTVPTSAGIDGPQFGVAEHYLPQLLEQYRIALQNPFNVQINNGQNIPYHLIPYNDLNVHGPIKKDEIPVQLLPSSSPQPAPVIHGNPDLPFLNTEVPIPMNPIILPTPIHDAQLSKPPTFPNSIQDIISPQQQPHQSGQMLPPPREQLPVGLPTPHGISIPPHQLPFIVKLPPRFPPAYMDFNLQHNVQGIVTHLQNNGQQPNTNGVEAAGKHKIYNNNTVHISDNRKGDRKYGIQRPYTISNLLDNEKKYYPIRQSQSSALKYYDKHHHERLRRYHKQKLANDINNKGGYILDF